MPHRPQPPAAGTAQPGEPLRGLGPDLEEAAGRISAARRAGRPAIWMLGEDVFCAGLGPVVGDLLQRGVVTHLATDGAGSTHDFELGLAGETGELASSGAGLAHEAGELLHGAVRAGVRDGLGWGEALGRFLAADPRARQRALSLLYQAYSLGVPYTVHATLGADAIDEHPACDFGALGWASGQDFRLLCASASGLAGGVVVNLGWPPGRQVLLRALSVAGRRGQATDDPTVIELGPMPPPGGWPGRWLRLAPGATEALRSLQASLAAILGDSLAVQPRPGQAGGNPVAALAERSAPAAAVLADLVARHPELGPAAESLARAEAAIAHSLERGGTLYLCGNGGSFADALHISGEMLKSYTRPRPLPPAHRERLAREPDGDVLAANLERGLRAVVLGANPSLASAVSNDFAQRHLGYAQELYALAHPGDVLLGISTSGRAANVRSAVSVARALGLVTVGLTGAAGGPLAERVDVAIRAPATRTDRVQEQHVLLYHALCEMLEVHLLSG